MIRDYIMFILIGVCGSLMIFSFITNSISKRRKYSLFLMAALAMILLIADKIATTFDGNPSIKEYWSARICKFLVYTLFLLIILVFNQYLKDLFVHEGHTQDIPKQLKYVDIIILFGELTLILGRIVGLYYSYEDNTYQRSKWFFISYIFPLISLIIQLSVIAKFHEKFRKRLLFPLVVFTVAPLAASVIQFFVHGVSLISCTIVSMVVLLYCFSILDTNRMIDKAHKKEVKLLLEKQENTRIMIDQTTAALVEAIDAKDNYTKGHSKRVAQYAVEIAKKAGKNPEECNEIHLVALLHDVGKIGIPDEIINKAGKLTDNENYIIQDHPIIGKEILDKISISPNLSLGASYHHERYDGNGYPFGLKGEEIPEVARIIAVADTYDAMASKRSYRDVMPQEVIRQEIEKGIGTQFDPIFAKIMLELIDADTEYRMKQS